MLAISTMSSPTDALRAAEERAAAAEAALAVTRASLAERAAQFAPFASAANDTNRAIDVLTICAQADGWAHDFRAVGSLCRATRAEEALWGALARVQHGVKKRTALQYAALTGDTARVKWLLARGSPLETSDSYGYTALFFACNKGHADTVRTLLASGAAVNAMNSRGFTPLMCACCGEGNEYLEIVQALLMTGADVNMSNCRKHTALMIASSLGHVNVVRALISAGADMGARSGTGVTALICAANDCAAVNGLTEVVRTLIFAGAAIDAVSDSGNTALHCASRRGRFCVALALIGCGANCALLNNGGATALDLASTDALRKLLRLVDKEAT